MINYEVKQRVKAILETNKEARDCDRLLIAEMWEQDMYYNDEFIIVDVLAMLKDGTLTNTESIRRCRQRLQEEFEHLRGLKYKVRQAKGEGIRKTINS